MFSFVYSLTMIWLKLLHAKLKFEKKITSFINKSITWKRHMRIMAFLKIFDTFSKYFIYYCQIFVCEFV